MRVNRGAVVLTGLAAFALSLVWYSPPVFGGVWLELSGADAAAMPLWKMLVAPLREIISASVLAFLIVRLRLSDWRGGLGLGLGLWLAFYAVQLSGAVIFDDMPWKLGAVHGGDWLMKMAFMAVVLSLWHRSRILGSAPAGIREPRA